MRAHEVVIQGGGTPRIIRETFPAASVTEVAAATGKVFLAAAISRPPGAPFVPFKLWFADPAIPANAGLYLTIPYRGTPFTFDRLAVESFWLQPVGADAVAEIVVSEAIPLNPQDSSKLGVS